MKQHFPSILPSLGAFLLPLLMTVGGAASAQWPCPGRTPEPTDTVFAARLDRAFRCATSGCCLQEAEQFLMHNDTSGLRPLDRARILLMQVMVGSLSVEEKIKRAERAEELLTDAEGGADRIRNTRVWVSVLLADAYAETPDSEKFGHYCSEVQRLFDEGVTDTAALVLGSGKMVAYHAIAGNLPRAEEAAHRAYRLGRNAPLEKTLNAAFLNLAFLKYNMGQRDSAALYAQQALEVARGRDFRYLTARAAQILGFVHHDQGNYPAYLQMADSSLSAILRTGNGLYIANGYQQKANALNKNRQYDLALKVAETGLAYSPSDFHVRRELHRVMVEAADSLGDHRTALSLQRLLTDTKDSIHAQNLEQTLSRLNAQYESDRKDALIAQLETEQLQSELRTQRLVLFGISVFLLFVLAASVALIIYRNRKQQAERQLYEQQHRQDRELLHAVEEERRRISTMLHDTVAGSLSGMTYLTEYINGIGDPQQRELQLAELRQRLDAAYQQVRDISHELLPFGEYGGEDFQERLVTFLENRFGLGPLELNLLLDHPQVMSRLTHTQQMLIYRMLQESISNAMKHSGGTEVTVESVLEDDVLVMRVTDDGAGMKTKAYGIGLANLQHLSEQHGAELLILAPKGEGTCVELRLRPTNRLRP